MSRISLALVSGFVFLAIAYSAGYLHWRAGGFEVPREDIPVTVAFLPVKKPITWHFGVAKSQAVAAGIAWVPALLVVVAPQRSRITRALFCSRPTCPFCGYRLDFLQNPRCSECGARFGALKSTALLRLAGVVSIVGCLLLLLVAWERHDAHAKIVRAVDQKVTKPHMPPSVVQLRRERANAAMHGELDARIPEATQRALLFAALSGLAGAACLTVSARRTRRILKERLREGRDVGQAAWRAARGGPKDT